MTEDMTSRMLEFVSSCDDPEKLRGIMRNAQKKHVGELADAAFRKLVSILPSEKPGTLEHDFWRMIHAFEHVLSEERGKTVRASRTRQKVDRAGIDRTLTDWATKPATKLATDGFRMLQERDMLELSGEAIVLRHPDRFPPETVEAARARLEAAGADIAKATNYR